MGYEEEQDARSDFLAENSPNCDDCPIGNWDKNDCMSCNKYEEGVKKGLSSRLKFHYNRINKTKMHVDEILATYSKDDIIMNEIKTLFSKLWVFLFNQDDVEDFTKCPCKRECEF